MKTSFVLPAIILMNIMMVKSQDKENAFHDAALYTTFQWSAEEPVVCTPQFYFYMKNFYLEARYNYEDLQTFSIYMGRSFTFDKKSYIEITPMLGGVVGSTNGLSPGFNFELESGSFATSTQCQYTVDLEDLSSSFFWNWTNFCFNFSEHFGLGGGVQAFIPLSGEKNISAGPMIALGYKRLSIEMYVYNFWERQPTYAVGLVYDFMPSSDD